MRNRIIKTQFYQKLHVICKTFRTQKDTHKETKLCRIWHRLEAILRQTFPEYFSTEKKADLPADNNNNLKLIILDFQQINNDDALSLLSSQ